MIVEHQILENVLLLKPNIYKDERGYFFESFRESIFKKNGYNISSIKGDETDSLILLAFTEKYNRKNIDNFVSYLKQYKS